MVDGASGAWRRTTRDERRTPAKSPDEQACQRKDWPQKRVRERRMQASVMWRVRQGGEGEEPVIFVRGRREGRREGRRTGEMSGRTGREEAKDGIMRLLAKEDWGQCPTTALKARTDASSVSKKTKRSLLSFDTVDVKTRSADKDDGTLTTAANAEKVPADNGNATPSLNKNGRTPQLDSDSGTLSPADDARKLPPAADAGTVSSDGGDEIVTTDEESRHPQNMLDRCRPTKIEERSCSNKTLKTVSRNEERRRPEKKLDNRRAKKMSAVPLLVFHSLSHCR